MQETARDAFLIGSFSLLEKSSPKNIVSPTGLRMNVTHPIIDATTL